MDNYSSIASFIKKTSNHRENRIHNFLEGIAVFRIRQKSSKKFELPPDEVTKKPVRMGLAFFFVFIGLLEIL